MAKFFLGDTLPEVAGAPDVYRHARGIKERGVPVQPGEELLLTKTLFCILQIQNDREETEQHRALCLLAALVLAVIEDEDFFVPLEPARAIERDDLELLAIELMRAHDQESLSLGATIGVWDLSISSAQDLPRIRQRLPEVDAELDATLTKLEVHLRQGEEIFARHEDPERRARHGILLDAARRRATFLLARLLTLPAARDHPVVRGNLLRRELRRIEVDALGAERISQAEQERRTRELLRWTEEELGEALTDENKAELARKLQEAAADSHLDLGPGDSGSWFFGME